MNDVVCGDCLDIMSGMPAGSVDLIVTSPPYADRRKKQYGGISAGEYVKWFMPRASGMRRVLRERGSLIVVIKEHTVDGERSEYVMDLVRAMRRGGWKWIDDYVWYKPNPSPGRWPSRLKDGWEHCLHFSHTVRPTMFPEAVAAPSKSKALKRSTVAYKNNDMPHGNRHGMGGVTHASIAKSAKRIGYQSKKTGSGFNYDYSGDDDRYFALPSNVITAGIIYHKIKHPAVFPIEIPTFFIKLFTQTGDAVMDPFCGSGTTLLAASKLGRRYVGMDTSAEYCDNTRRRVAEVQQVMEASE